RPVVDVHGANENAGAVDGDRPGEARHAVGVPQVHHVIPALDVDGQGPGGRLHVDGVDAHTGVEDGSNRARGAGDGVGIVEAAAQDGQQVEVGRRPEVDGGRGQAGEAGGGEQDVGVAGEVGVVADVDAGGSGAADGDGLGDARDTAIVAEVHHVVAA